MIIRNSDHLVDEQAKAYVDLLGGGTYRIKVFANTVWVEQQRPHRDNLVFDRSKFNVWDGEWNKDVLLALLAQYGYEVDPNEDAPHPDDIVDWDDLPPDIQAWMSLNYL